MVLVQSSKLSPPPSLPPPKSILFEPNSHSLALMHTDSSVSLFPCLSFPSPPPLPPKPQILVPSPSSSSSFLLIHQDPIPKVLFLVASPYKGGSQILLRFYLLQKENIFYKPQVVCNQKGIALDSKLGVLLDINHGVSIKIVGSVNFFVLHSVSSKKVCVFAVKLIDDGDGEMVKLMRCAVIECNVPVWSISVSSGVLVLGEDNGVRVFNLRQLVKGRVKNVKGINSNGKSDGKGLKLPNGVVGDDYFHGSSSGNGSNGVLDMKTDKQCVSDHEMDDLILSKVLSCVKLKSVRCKQDSGEGSACFVAFKREEIEVLKPTTSKAVSIQALSHKKFVILDSMGDLHILCLSAPVIGSNFMAHMRRLPHSMKVQKLAVLPDVSLSITLEMQTFWVSDGLHSVHTITLSDMGAAVNSNNEDETQEMLIQTTVIQAIFSAEKIQDLIPLGANGILILGQGNLSFLQSKKYIFICNSLKMLGTWNPCVAEVMSCRCCTRTQRHRAREGM
ncbi:hypothetical protein DKX38_027222 [Salix brachista]|uniref:Cleavage/polyadenylation specificity factor A subunit N-terminal domain-containing protein n=1 Tax=Salix brachista TaxID=2182728 RepID=A0A5N5JF45_9ROSI|nr:hypothetical protein DKX38_027222 [Salix brachista]